MPDCCSPGVETGVMESERGDRFLPPLAFAQHDGEIQAHRNGNHPFNHPDTWHYVLGEKTVHTKKLLPGIVIVLVIDLAELAQAERPQHTQEVIVSQMSD